MRVTLLEATASDLNVVNAARVSFAGLSKMERTLLDRLLGRPGKLSDKDRGLISFLLRNHHGTPFEHGYFRFHVEAPIFVIRDWFRHRIGHSYNEWSGRYSELEEKFYQPEEWRVQVGKPGAYTFEPIDDPEKSRYCDFTLERAYKHAWGAYRTLLDEGVAKEHARMVLPVGIYSQFHWTCNPRSLMHFCGLRNSPHAQQEIRECAIMAEEALKIHMPKTHLAFIAYGRTAP